MILIKEFYVLDEEKYKLNGRENVVYIFRSGLEGWYELLEWNWRGRRVF